jgi:putative flippase GtrA
MRDQARALQQPDPEQSSGPDASAGLRARLRAVAVRPLRFLAAGGAAAALNWGLRLALSPVMPFVPAMLVAAAAGMTLGFLLYSRFVFADGAPRPLARRVRDFLAVNAVSTVLVVSVAWGVNRLLGGVFGLSAVTEAAAHAVGIGAGAVSNYFGHRAVTFRVLHKTVRRAPPAAASGRTGSGYSDRRRRGADRSAA